MKNIALSLLIASTVLADTATVTPCGGAVCVGTNRQPIVLGGQVQVTAAYPAGDGGIIRISPAYPTTPLELKGNETGAITTPDIIIGSVNSRTSAGTLVSFRANQTEVASIMGDGTFTGSLTGTGKFGVLDAGVANIQGNLGVAGAATVAGAVNTLAIDAGSGYIVAGFGVGGTSTLQAVTATAVTASTSVKTAILDAGYAQINGATGILGTLTVVDVTALGTVDAGALEVRGSAQVDGNLILTNTTAVGTCTLNGGTPSTCTATVRAGSKCQCTPVGGTAVIAAGGCAVGLSSTTLTCTSFATASNNVNYVCF